MESCLLGLRAELLKKKAELNKSHEVQINLKSIKPLYKEPKKLKHKKIKASGEVSLAESEDNLKHEKSREALEKKALLYDQIKNGTKVLDDDELNERFLVDFQGKFFKEVADAKEAQKKSTEEHSIKDDDKSYKAENPTDEWVEYTDSFGRSRVCLQKDVKYMQEKLTAEKSQKVLHDKWDKIEDDSKVKTDLHYQDVLFDEARSHGTSFMPFSRDEKERESQQHLLKDIGSEATKIALTKEALRRKRQKMMNERLVKVRQKKRLKMGLPVKDDERYKTPPPSDDEDNDVTSEEAKEISENIAEDASKADESDSKYPVREWDIGKPGVSSVLNQAQWIESKRKERENEFAPPTSYHGNNTNNKIDKRSFKNKNKKDNSNQSSYIDSMNKKNEERCSEFSPPTTYEYYRPLTTKKNYFTKPKIDLEAAISKGLSQIRNDCAKNDV